MNSEVITAGAGVWGFVLGEVVGRLSHYFRDNASEALGKGAWGILAAVAVGEAIGGYLYGNHDLMAMGVAATIGLCEGHFGLLVQRFR